MHCALSTEHSECTQYSVHNTSLALKCTEHSVLSKQRALSTQCPSPSRHSVLSASIVCGPGGCHRCCAGMRPFRVTLRFDTLVSGPLPPSDCVESIGDCLQRFPFAPRMRTGAWMLDTSTRIAPMQILLDRGLSQAGVLDRRLSHATWASYWSNRALWTRQRSTKDFAACEPAPLQAGGIFPSVCTPA